MEQIRKELIDDKYLPNDTELEDLKYRLNAELEKLV